MSKVIKAAIYARCSDIKQTEKDLSIPAQLDAARAEAKRRGWEVVSEYIDASETGKNDDRAKLQEMLHVARTRKPVPFQRIIVWKFSRFMRNLYQSAIHKTMLMKAKPGAVEKAKKYAKTPDDLRELIQQLKIRNYIR